MTTTMVMIVGSGQAGGQDGNQFWRAGDAVKQMDEKEQFGVKRDGQRKVSPCVCMSQEKGIAVLDVGDDQKNALQ